MFLAMEGGLPPHFLFSFLPSFPPLSSPHPSIIKAVTFPAETQLQEGPTGGQHSLHVSPWLATHLLESAELPTTSPEWPARSLRAQGQPSATFHLGALVSSYNMVWKASHSF